MNLIPLSEYVFQEETKIIAHLDKEMSNGNDIRAILNFSKKVRNYTKFLRQPLTLSMFVPVDDEGEVLNYDEIRVSVQEGTETWDIWTNAKERVLFEGFNIIREKTGSYYLVIGQYLTFAEKEYKCAWEFVKRFQYVECLLKSGVEITLTPSALKLIGEKE